MSSATPTRKPARGRHDRLTVKLCDELIDIARAAGDAEGERLARALKRAVKGGDEGAIARLRGELDAHAREIEGH